MRYSARWVLPVSAPPLRDGAVSVHDGRITDVGPRGDARAGDVDLGDAVLLPGLVNTHTHLDLAPLAGLLPRTNFFPWVRTLVRAWSEAADDGVRAASARWSAADQAAHGVTMIGDTGPTRAGFDAMRAVGVRGVAYIEAFAPDPAHVDAALAQLRAAVTDARREESPAVRVGVSPHAPYSVADALYHGVGAFAREQHLPIAVHIAESPDEFALVSAASGPFADLLRGRGIAVEPRARSPIALLAQTGVLGDSTLCIHAVFVDAEDIRAIADAGASVAHCPRANAWFGSPAAPRAAFVEAGITVGLGTDSVANNASVRVLAELGAVSRDLTARERLRLATESGARALGAGDVVGTLEPGRFADLAAFAVGDVAACDADPESYVVTRCAHAPALLTLVGGHVVARNGVAIADEVQASESVVRARVRLVAWAQRTGLAPQTSAFLD